MRFYVPVIDLPLYGIIVLTSILIGIVVAAVMMIRSGAKKETVLYTSMLAFVSIIICSFGLSTILYQDIRKVGFVAAGGAVGLLIGVLISVLINHDHEKDTIVAWILVAPLMYGLSKIACHFAGCCYGIPYNGIFSVTYETKEHISYFPVQLSETVIFLLIFFIGLIMYRKVSKKMEAARVVLILSAIAKIGMDFLRDAHVGEVISANQIMIAIIAGAAFILSFLWG